jgi:hypothetical protein
VTGRCCWTEQMARPCSAQAKNNILMDTSMLMASRAPGGLILYASSQVCVEAL